MLGKIVHQSRFRGVFQELLFQVRKARIAGDLFRRLGIEILSNSHQPFKLVQTNIVAQQSLTELYLPIVSNAFLIIIIMCIFPSDLAAHAVVIEQILKYCREDVEMLLTCC